MRFNDLRHLHATILLMAVVPIHVVAARLGHSNPSMTMIVYAHVLQDQAANTADVFASAVEEGH
jgi:integrase